MTDLSLPRPTRLSLTGSKRLTRAVRAVPPELALLLALAALLNLWALSRNGWANDYYAAAVRSMAGSWHDFLYGSLDSAGLQTVDKPPMALWVQALSVRAFGFSSLSILIPQALMGVASAGLVYDLTRRRFGRFAAFGAGIALATTPIFVAVSRHNNPDALLILCSTAALWAVVRALEAGKTRWLVIAGVCIGLGFETKMAAALLIVPGLAAAYLWIAPRGRWTAVRQLGLGGLAMVVVGGAWPLLVYLTPAADRPWISGTSDNSVFSLVLGYNGLGRLAGQAGGPSSMGGGGGGGGGTSTLFGGDTGPLRLLNSALGGQGGWLLGFAVAAGIALVVSTRLRRSDARTGWLIAVGGAFAVIAVAFSVASGIFHPYYVSLLAPFTAALVGAGVAQLAGGDRLARIAAPLLIAAGVIVELVVRHNAATLTWLAPVLVVGGIVAAVALAAPLAGRWRAAVVAATLALLLLAPATWAVQTLGHATSGTFPMGGPETASVMGGGRGGGGPGGGGGGFGGGQAPTGTRGGTPPQMGTGTAGATGATAGGSTASGSASSATGSAAVGGLFGSSASAQGGGGTGGGGAMFGGDSSELTSALAYIKQHGGGVLGVSSQSTAASAILDSNAQVAGLGGFSGSESEVSINWLVQAVRDGKIRWVMTTSSGMGSSGGRVGATKLMAAVAKVGRSTSVSGLYDLKGLADKLAATA